MAHNPSSPLEDAPFIPGVEGLTGNALVVDDDPMVGEVISEALERLGIKVDKVGSADEALVYLKKNLPDLVISDWKMPGMNGIELLTRIKTVDPHIAAILMTGYGTKETVIEAFTKGRINYYLAKPFKINDLLEVVSASIKERKLGLSEQAFQRRLEREIQRATDELAQKNKLLQQKQAESDQLYQELKAGKKEVENTKNYLEDLLESSVDAIISVSKEQKIVFFSRGAEEIFGVHSKNILGRHLDNLFPDQATDLTRLMDELHKKQRVKHFEASMLHHSGRVFVADIAASRLRRTHNHQEILLIVKDIAERKRLEEELRSSNAVLEKLAITDGLTNLFNHRHFQKCMADEFQRSERYQSHLSLIMLDLDDFKRVNDTYGHQTGDRTLQLLADLIRESVREVDIPARYGGEEFAVILPQTDVFSAVHVAQRIKDAVEDSPRFQEIHPNLKITASLGLAGYPGPDNKSAQDLIRHADRALFRAKEIGKNRIVIGSGQGDHPIGRGEHLTQSEKKLTLRRVSSRIKGTLDLKDILNYLLEEVSLSLRQTESEPPCSVMLMDPQLGLLEVAKNFKGTERSRDFDIAAHLALEKRSVHVFYDYDEYGPAASYPIIIDWPDRGEEVVGVINIGAVPSDLDFFRDLANQAAMGILNAKLYTEMKNIRTSLEQKVNQLMTLSMMGMALQRNALTFEDFEPENRMLLARCLAKIGFDRVLVFLVDRDENRLFGGVDSSLRGNGVPQAIDLSHLPPDSHVLKATQSKAPTYNPLVLLAHRKDLGPADQQFLRSLGLDREEIAMAKWIEGGKTKALIMASKNEMIREDGEALSMFVLHASLINENLNLTRLYQEKSRRLTLVHQTGLDLSLAATPEARKAVIQTALDRLTEILGVTEISVYSLQGNRLPLLAFSSATAQPGQEPVGSIRLTETKLMGKVIENAQKTGQTKPLVINRLKSKPGFKTRKRYRSDSYMGVPLFAGGELLGLLNLTDKTNVSDFSEEDGDLAQITGGIIASVLFRMAHANKIKVETLKAIRALVEIAESLGDNSSKGHARRVAELSADLARLWGIELEDTIRIQEEVWLNEFCFDHLSSDAVSQGCVKAALVLGDWIRMLEDLGMNRTTNGTGSCPLAPDHPARKIIKVAKAFETAYLALAPSKRPSLDSVLFHMALNPDLETEIIAALIRGLVAGEIRHGRRKLLLEQEGLRILLHNLASDSGQAQPEENDRSRRLTHLIEHLAENAPLHLT